MQKLCPDRYKFADKYVVLFQTVHSQLFEIYEHIVRNSEWCKVPALLADEVEEGPDPVRVDAVSPDQGHDVVQNAKKALPVKARPALPDRTALPAALPETTAADGAFGAPRPATAVFGKMPSQKRRSEEIEAERKAKPLPYRRFPSSDPPSSVNEERAAAPVKKKMPPPPPPPPYPFPSMPHAAARASSLPDPAPAPPPPREAFELQPPFVAGPKEPSHPPPAHLRGPPARKPAEPSDAPPPKRTNRWTRDQTPRLGVTSEKGMTSEKGITSEKKNKLTDPNDVSVMPLPPQAEIDRHENYVKYVKTMVQRWLNLQGEEYYKKNPKYERSAVTNFLFMTLLASFLEVANASGMAAFKYMHGHKEFYYEHRLWQKMEALTMKKWIAHNRSGWIWKYMSTRLGIRNFAPEDPADIENWKNWLTQDQVIQLMTWLFDECWRDNPDRSNHYETTMQFGIIMMRTTTCSNILKKSSG